MPDGAAARLRRAGIERLLGHSAVRVDELAERFGVSPSTIRRDLGALGREERVLRTYGGAAPPRETSLHERSLVASEAKQAIARAAAELVPDAGVVILDAGSTTAALAVEIADRTGLTIVTNSLPVAGILSQSPGVDVVLLGGTVRALSSGTVGPLAETALAGITADIAFVSADGVVAGRGLSEGSDRQAALKHRMLEAAGEIVVLADASKLGDRSSHWWTPLDRPWRLVTDPAATVRQLEPFEALGVKVVVAGGRP